MVKTRSMTRIKNTKKVASKADDPCAICFSTVRKKTALDGCTHNFCLKCIRTWAKKNNSCPCCRAKFNRLTHGKKNIAIPDVVRRISYDMMTVIDGLIEQLQRWNNDTELEEITISSNINPFAFPENYIYSTVCRLNAIMFFIKCPLFRDLLMDILSISEVGPFTRSELRVGRMLFRVVDRFMDFSTLMETTNVSHFLLDWTREAREVVRNNPLEVDERTLRGVGMSVCPWIHVLRVVNDLRGYGSDIPSLTVRDGESHMEYIRRVPLV